MADTQIYDFADAGAGQDADLLIIQRGTGANSGFKLSLRQLRQFVSLKEHNPNTPYLAGMGCIKNGRLYTALVDNQGVFNPAQWSEVAITGTRDVVAIDEQVTVTSGSQHFVYGDQVINGVFTNNGRMIIMDGLLKGEGLLKGDGFIKTVTN